MTRLLVASAIFSCIGFGNLQAAMLAAPDNQVDSSPTDCAALISKANNGTTLAKEELGKFVRCITWAKPGGVAPATESTMAPSIYGNAPAEALVKPDPYSPFSPFDKHGS